MDDAAGPRRFSVNSALLPKFGDDGAGRKLSYASTPSETDILLAAGTVEEITSLRKESKLLFRYSLPLTLTYLLQVSYPCSARKVEADSNSTLSHW